MEGWGKHPRSYKRHYFKPDGNSLCGKWHLVSSELRPDMKSDTTRQDNCKRCRAAVAAGLYIIKWVEKHRDEWERLRRATEPTPTAE